MHMYIKKNRASVSCESKKMNKKKDYHSVCHKAVRFDYTVVSPCLLLASLV